MRWITRPEPGSPNERVRRIFLLWPVTMYQSNGVGETRWLEWATVKEDWYPGYETTSDWWEIVEFID